jgi:hypothetical protein
MFRTKSFVAIPAADIKSPRDGSRKENDMSSDQITGILRAICAAIGGFVLAKGWVSSETWAWIVGGVATIGPAIWSWVSNRPAAIAASAQNLTGVTVTTNASASTAVTQAVAAAKAA